MNSKLVLFFTLCASSVALVKAMPYELSTVKAYMMSDVAEKTLCPMRITLNDNEKRIPRYIRFIYCDVEKILSSNSEQDQCSATPGGLHGRSCVQLEDFAPVQYLMEDGSYTNSSVKVAVGCSCMEEPVRSVDEPES